MLSFGMRPANLLETIFDQVQVAVVVVDADHRVVYANDPALHILEIPRAKLADPLRLEDLSSDYHFFDSHGKEVPFEQGPIHRVLAGGTVESHNTKLGLPGGRFKWLHLTAHHFSVMGFSGALVVATDETHEVELQHVAASIQRVEVLSALAGAMAHNFNNIIEIIVLSAQACLEDQNAGPLQRARVQQIADAARRASDLTKRLAQFSRIQELQLRSISINPLVRDVLSLIEPLLYRNIKLTEKLQPDLPEVEVDRVQMEQVILNLMLNARDAMPNGGRLVIATGLRWRPAATTIRGDVEQCVTITVADSGSGIPEDIRDHVFEPFFTTKPNGTGLGLASALGIVRQHGGDITVESEVGKGTQFTVYLPPCRRQVSMGDGRTAGP